MGRHGAGLKELRIWKTPAVVPPPPPVPTPSQINWVTGRRLHALHSIRVAGVVNGRLTPIWQNSGQCCLIAALLPPDGVAMQFAEYARPVQVVPGGFSFVPAAGGRPTRRPFVWRACFVLRMGPPAVDTRRRSWL